VVGDQEGGGRTKKSSSWRPGLARGRFGREGEGRRDHWGGLELMNLGGRAGHS